MVTQAKRILIVEDEPLISLDLARVVETAGYAVVGPAANVAAALKLIAGEGCNAAILDVNLCGESSAPVADEMRRRSLPFVVVSGYTKTQHPKAMAGAPFLSKPVDTAQLVSSLSRLVG